MIYIIALQYMNYDVNAGYGQDNFRLRHLPQSVHQSVCESFLTVAAVDVLSLRYCSVLLLDLPG